jgi:hypothetical protein
MDDEKLFVAGKDQTLPASQPVPKFKLAESVQIDREEEPGRQKDLVLFIVRFRQESKF